MLELIMIIAIIYTFSCEFGVAFSRALIPDSPSSPYIPSGGDSAESPAPYYSPPDDSAESPAPDINPFDSLDESTGPYSRTLRYFDVTLYGEVADLKRAI